jgi:AcrR family transcriptional regulator
MAMKSGADTASLYRPLARPSAAGEPVDKSERSFYYPGMGKGEQTREAILLHALKLATKVGFEGLTIGRLADELKLSKSGLFAHFGSKESLQVKVLELASRRFIDEVVRPALVAPRGIRRVRALFEHWLAWETSPSLPGGCPFNAAATELDDRPGAARDFVVRSQHDWLETIANTARTAVQEGDFEAGLECEQFAYELQSIMLGYAHASRLMKDPKARARTEAAFDGLLRRAAASEPTVPKTGARRR